jgi:hypothetical protein
MGVDDAADDLGDEMGADMGDEPVDGDEQLDEIQASINDLIARFDELMGDEGVEGDDVAPEAVDADADVDAAPVDADEPANDEFSFDDEKDADDTVKESEGDEGEDEDADEFDDITESILAELEKVTVTSGDDKEIGTGKSTGANKASPVPSKKAEPKDAKPTPIKSSNHTGYEREQAPAVKTMKKRSNTLSKATEKNVKVSKEGDKSSLLNKDHAGSAGNDKSPLAKKGSPF